MTCPKSRSRSIFFSHFWVSRCGFSARTGWFSLVQLGSGLMLAIGVGQAAARSADLETIRSRGYLTVAVQAQAYPLSFRDEQGQLTGWEIEIAQRLAQELVGQPNALRLQAVRNVDRLQVVIEGKADLAIARVSATAARRRLVDFSVPYYFDGTGLVTQQTTVRSLSDLNRRRIAVLANSTTVYTLQYSLPQAQVSFVASYAEAVAQLNSGAIDVFAADQSVLSGWQRQDGRYRLLPFQLSIEPLAIVLPKGLHHAELRNRVNQSIQQWRQEGWLQERAAFWGLPWAIVETK
jgi:polar amino acid transport system substrate-binding protein